MKSDSTNYGSFQVTHLLFDRQFCEINLLGREEWITHLLLGIGFPEMTAYAIVSLTLYCSLIFYCFAKKWHMPLTSYLALDEMRHDYLSEKKIEPLTSC